MDKKIKTELKLDCRLSKDEIYNFLYKCNDHFPVDLSSLVDLKEYSVKLAKFSTQTCYYANDELVGMLLYYSNNDGMKTAFIPIICNFKNYQGLGIGDQLLSESLNSLQLKGYQSVKLEVHKVNPNSLDLFFKHGFNIISDTPDLYILKKVLNYNEQSETSDELNIQFA